MLISALLAAAAAGNAASAAYSANLNKNNSSETSGKSSIVYSDFNTRYTCVWYRGEDAILIPVYSYYRKKAGVDPDMLLYIDENENNFLTISGDYLIVESNEYLSSYEVALFYAEAKVGENGKIYTYDDLTEEKGKSLTKK